MEQRTLLSAGDLDPSFGTGGKLTTDFQASNADRPRQIALQADGKLVEVAWHQAFGAGEPTLAVSRFSTDGTLDADFGDGGIRLVDFPARGEVFGSIDVAPSGKIVVATWSFAPTTDFLGPDSDVSVAVLNPDGSFDASFDGDGMKLVDLGQTFGGPTASTTPDLVWDVAVQGDGKIIAASGMTLGTQGVFALVRLNTDGTVDGGFGTNGVAAAPFANYSGGAFAVTVDSQDRVVAAGTAGIPGTNGRVTNSEFVVARYNPDGSLDTSFDGDGFAVTSFSTSNETVSAVEMTTDGKIVVAGGAPGAATGDIAVARYNDDGSPDASFDGDGKALINLTGQNSQGQTVSTNESALGLAVQDDGSILLSGRNTSGAGVNFVGGTFLLRLDPSGAPDPGFGDNGKVVSELDEGADVVVSPDDGSIYLGGHVIGPDTGFEDFAASRYDASGNLDTSYGQGGIASADFPGPGFNAAVAAAVDSQGRVIAGGFIIPRGSIRNLAFARYSSDGSLDSTFGNAGRSQIDFGDRFNHTERVTALTVDGQDRVVFAGIAIDSASDLEKIIVGRLLPDGSLDPDFASGTGLLVVEAFDGNAASNDLARDILIDPEGRIVVAGEYEPSTTSREFAVLRLDGNGDLDAGFGPAGGGMVHLAVGGTDSTANGVALAPDQDGQGYDVVLAGRAIIGGNNLFALVRLNDDGGLDPAFGGGTGKVTTPMGNSNGIANDVAVDSQGFIVVGGTARVTSPANQGDNFALARYGPDGQLDPTFGTGGKVLTDFFLGTDQLNSLLVLPDRSIVAAGQASTPSLPTQISSVLDFGLARYTAAGALDPAFGDGGKVMTNFSEGTWPSSPSTSRDSASRLLPYPGDRVVAVGTAILPRTGSDFALARYNLIDAPPPAHVSARRLVYNRSAYDGNDPAITDADLDAIPADKDGLMPGQAATFANLSSYARGINGIAVRFDRELPALAADDFAFRFLEARPGSAWVAAPAPNAFATRPGASGPGTFALLTWPDGAVKNGWLEVTVRANDRTRLASPDVFYFGSLIGESGDSPTTFRVNALDLAAVKQALNRNSTITGRFDFNRDGRTNALDLAAVRSNLNGTLAAPPAAAVASASTNQSTDSATSMLRDQ